MLLLRACMALFHSFYQFLRQVQDLKAANQSASAAYEQEIRSLNQNVNKLESKLALVEDQLHNSSIKVSLLALCVVLC